MWSRFIEPQQIIVQETTIDLWIDKTIALVADMHLWVYKDRYYLQRVVNEINKQQPDMVVIAWDFVNHVLLEQEFDELFAPLADLEMPVYAVLGNHDLPVSWNNDRLGLVQALKEHGVQLLNNESVLLDGYRLVWLWSHLWNEDDVDILDQFTESDTIIALMHNPDTTLSFESWVVDLSLAGHTHCGQIKLPFIHEMIRWLYYPVVGDFDCWLSEERNTTLYITPWLWEVIIPFRFQVPPSIDLLVL